MMMMRISSAETSIPVITGIKKTSALRQKFL
jgi:hypothetical protein